MKTKFHTICHQDQRRGYVACIPKRPAVGMPLIVACHGGYGHPLVMRAEVGIEKWVSPRRPCAVVYPCGISDFGPFVNHWNAGSVDDSGIDDVGFLQAVIMDMHEQYKTSTRHVVITGISNGAYMAEKFAHHQPDNILGVFSVASSLGWPTTEQGAPVPCVHVHGTEDKICPYNGGTTPSYGGELLVRPSMQEYSEYWLERNRCRRIPSSTLHIGSGKIEMYSGDAMYALVTIEGGGHTWPGAKTKLPEFIVGHTAEDVPTSLLVLAFLDLLMG